ncbi:hypothetical protein B1A_12971 [mine drainage metagenome]|uniref:PD-(D/E)XK endonuclease-like domain-containing protein n=1 Tax=mine drainage metagenome TaxID=410659 RepID=T1BF63_9ZZZZ
MSLTSIMKSGFSKEVVKAIATPFFKFESSKDCIACPKTKNYSLIGTAFDYLLRSELRRLHPNAIEKSLIAENSIDLVNGHVQIEGYFSAKNQKIGKKELRSMKDVAKKYREERTQFIENGVLKNSFLETTIKFARMDVVFRAGVYDDVEKEVDFLDIEDMKALYNLVPNNFKNSSSLIMLDPAFGSASMMVGGADVDLIIGDTMIDIKTTKEMKLDEYFWSQIVGYSILANKARETETSFPVIKKLGLYFSRYGKLWEIDADYVYKNPNYEELKRKLIEAGSKLFSIG